MSLESATADAEDDDRRKGRTTRRHREALIGILHLSSGRMDQEAQTTVLNLDPTCRGGSSGSNVDGGIVARAASNSDRTDSWLIRD